MEGMAGDKDVSQLSGNAKPPRAELCGRARGAGGPGINHSVLLIFNV